MCVTRTRCAFVALRCCPIYLLHWLIANRHGAQNCIGFVHNRAADPPYCVLKAAGDTMYENEAKDVYMKDDTVDFETQMTASRGRHCECAAITYMEPDGSSVDGGAGVGGSGGRPGGGPGGGH